MQDAANIVRGFLSQIFDEWITGVDSSANPTVNAQICRALSMAVGPDVFKETVKSLLAEGVIDVVSQFEHASPDEVSIIVLDYCLK